MSDASILREYLISLGFQVNWQDGAKTDKLLAGLDKKVWGLGIKFLSVSTAVAGMVTVFASQMQKLHYQSLLTGETVDNLQAVAFAAKQIGIGGEEMIAALQGMQRAIRLNPGLKGLLAQLGVDTKAGPVDQLKQLVSVLRTMPPHIASQFAGLFGIDPDQLLLLSKGLDKLDAAQKLRKQMAQDAGLDLDKAAEAGLRYAQSLSEIYELLGILKDTLAVALLPSFTEIAGVTKEVLKDWIAIVRNIKEAGAGQFWDRLAEGMGLKTPQGGVKLTKEAEARTGTDTTPKYQSEWQARMAPYGGLLGWLKNGNMLDRPVRNKDGTWSPPPSVNLRAETSKVAEGAVNSASSTLSDWKTAFLKWGGAKSQMPLGLRQNNPGNMRDWDRGNETKANGFVNFDSMEKGLSAMAGQLLKYEEAGRNTIQKIISTWAPKSDNNDTDSYIKNVAAALGVKADAALNLRDPETLRKLMAAMIRQEQGVNPFSSADLERAISSRLGSTGVTLQQTTNINVYGGGSANDTAREVFRGQERINGDLVRDMRGAMR